MITTPLSTRSAPPEGTASDLPAWERSMRREARERFDAVGFPGPRDEEWRHTQLNPIIRGTFAPAPATICVAALDRARRALQAWSLGAEAPTELVFVDGIFSAALSRASELPEGLSAGAIRAAIAAGDRRIEAHLSRHARIQTSPFVALNTAGFTDGAFIHAAAGADLSDHPIHLLFLSTAESAVAVTHPRSLLIAEAGAKLTIIETYAGAPPADATQPGSPAGEYWTNAVTEMVLGRDAQVDHCKMQQESLQAYHVAWMQADLDAGADLVSHSTTLGGRITRNDLRVLLDGENAHATLNGLVLLSGEQHCDNHTLLHHEKAHCPSHELYKHVLDGKSTAVFRGKIFVQKDAQKTDSKQTSKSLLLSDDAYMNSQPALEIYADDVKCTHGSTIGPVDDDMVFYLRTRGMGLDAARHLLTYAFAADITRRIRVAAVRNRIEDYMAAQHGLPQDLRITDLGSHDERAR